MYEIVTEFPNEIIYKEGEPCITLYQTTHRYAPENRQEPIVFKHLVHQIEESLEQKYPNFDSKLMMESFYELQEDHAFWAHTLDGLAILASPNGCIVYLLNFPVDNLAIVADSFRIKPLIRYFQSAETYCLLGLSSNNISFFVGNRYGVNEIELGAEMTGQIEEIIGKDHADGFLTHGRFGGTDGNATFHGHGGRKDAIDIDIERFFRYVDKAVLENFSKPMKLPMILVSLTEHQSMFRKLSNNPYLVPEGIEISYEALDLGQLTCKAWEIMEPLYLEKTQLLADRFKTAEAKDLGSDKLTEVGQAVFEGRVETILVEADKIIPGRFDADTGKVELGSIDDPECGDAIDQIVKTVLRDKGDVVVIPADKMPTKTGVAAIYRF